MIPAEAIVFGISLPLAAIALIMRKRIKMRSKASLNNQSHRDPGQNEYL